MPFTIGIKVGKWFTLCGIEVKNCKKTLKYLRVSKKSSTFAADFIKCDLINP